MKQLAALFGGLATGSILLGMFIELVNSGKNNDTGKYYGPYSWGDVAVHSAISFGVLTLVAVTFILFVYAFESPNGDPRDN